MEYWNIATSPCCSVQKKHNFFDDDDDVEDFETFDDDKDFAKMTGSFTAKKKTDDSVEGEEKLGKAWGGDAYSFTQGLNKRITKIVHLNLIGHQSYFKQCTCLKMVTT